MSGRAMHYVCTYEEAEQLVQARGQFWVSNCGCREERPGCSMSRIDVCLSFVPEGSGTGLREITKDQALGLITEARLSALVPRPFRRPPDMVDVDGICLCCNCCCGYFLNPKEACDKGAQVESTDQSSCTACGLCVEPCFFNARRVVGDRLLIAADSCYGCGLCVSFCPEGCIHMTARA